jgi:hypothetical protein
MKNLLIFGFSLLTVIFNAEAVQISGRGFSPYIENDVPLSRMLATWDAISDALVKTQGSINGSLTVENNLINNHRITFKNNFEGVKLNERACETNSKQVVCSIIIDVQNSKIEQSSQILDLNECTKQGDGVEFCYEAQASYQETAFGFTAEVQTRIQIQWNVDGKSNVLYKESVISRGLGRTKAGSFQSGIHQALSRIRVQTKKWNQILNTFNELQLMIIENGIGKKLELYLKLMGGHTFELEGIRYILIPTIIVKS